ncbi:zinc finger E-box-binding homeobox 1-like [Anguilla anguilla]|uniref:zinc finger E-box-binding homeobox 1-like n=1 Tax=Anguilla anguilla TaxID=7936 RepID=UPI0015B1352B|nr:zinc finger E-box-binding homeobox 1-like [Anguilla anguilla]
MADGPRCKRRKQANPRRNNVTNYNNGAEATSDSDDEDKLHIVEEDSLPDGGDGGDTGDEAESDGNAPESRPDARAAVLTANGKQRHPQWDSEDLGPDAKKQRTRFKVKAESGSEPEENGSADAMVEEMLQQGDTAVIYPVAPEEEARQGTPEASGHDENGTPDAFSQLLTCPYCARGYKRYTSLKEHIKYRHEKSEDNFSCSLCSYTFAYRTQLDRHMTAHKSGREQRVHVTQSGGNRKFKCTECTKAFKYKHHLKEHLRIHSGEKPYECPNCKKRFSHSGSYSSHISSKKCIGPVPVNGRPRPGGKPALCPSPSPSLAPSPAPAGRTVAREKPDPGKPLQEQLPVTQIKAEPLEYEYKPVVLAPAANGVFNGGPALPPAPAPPQGVVQAVVLPTVGLVSPISINLSDLQSVLKVAVDGNVLRQVLESAHLNAANASKGPGGGVATATTATHSVISAISLPIVDQDGTTKIIINYSLEPSHNPHPAPPAPAPAPQAPKKEGPPARAPDAGKAETAPEDPAPKAEQNKEAEPAGSEGAGEAAGAGPDGERTCLLCDDCPGGLDALHTLKHCGREAADPAAADGERDGEGESGADPGGVSALLADGVAGQPPLKNLLSLLKAYFALNAEPTAAELAKIADSVSLPAHVVRRWFHKMRSGQIAVGGPPRPPQSGDEASEGGGAGAGSDPPADPDAPPPPATEALEEPADTDEDPSGDPPQDPPSSPLNLSSTGLVIVKSEEEEDEDGQAEPLDLSLPKLPREGGEGGGAAGLHQGSAYSVQEEPLNLTCAKKEPPAPAPLTSDTIYVTPSANPVSIVATQLPTILAITEQGSLPCLRAVTASKHTILIPQLAYTYATTATATAAASSPPAAPAPQKPLQPNGLQDERLDTSSEGVEEQNDSDSAPPRKKMRKTESGMYACDLCDKIFQKSSSLLRHKYEHTGKRPHECGICSKAFKHKHHLIEHMRLHSGEKPYQCDKCGKRFSHSGSYSQHMNHRYSYCKKEGQERQEGAEPGAQGGADTPAAGEQADGRTASPPSQPDSEDRDEEESEDEEEEEEEEEELEGGVSEDEIQVVRVGEGEDSEEEWREHAGEDEEEEPEEEGEELEQEGKETRGEEAWRDEEAQGVEEVRVGEVGLQEVEEETEGEMEGETEGETQEETAEEETQEETAEEETQEETAEEETQEETAEEETQEETAEEETQEETAEEETQEETAEEETQEETAEEETQEETAEEETQEETAEEETQEETAEEETQEETAEEETQEEMEEGEGETQEEMQKETEKETQEETEGETLEETQEEMEERQDKETQEETQEGHTQVEEEAMETQESEGGSGAVEEVERNAGEGSENKEKKEEAEEE